MAKDSFVKRLTAKCKSVFDYCRIGIWREQNDGLLTKVLKTLNLSVRSFLDSNLQRKASALTYNTVLAIVPAFALLFAIGRGFGFQNLLQDQLYSYFPAQSTAISTALQFVDSYLAQASQGIFVGIGIVFLLWTLISLLGNIEKAFNDIWGLKKSRSFYRKLTDYTAIFLMIPVLMVCSSGISIFMTETIQNNIDFRFLSPVFEVIMDVMPFVLTCGAFMLSFLLIPNTKVKVKYAAIAGVVCGISFQILQYLFVSGQMYVSKYNAIYGSFAFLPLLLIWLQLSWLILLFGCLLTYSSQNIFRFDFTDDITGISERYLKNITIVITAIIVHRFEQRLTPLTTEEISAQHNIPIRLASQIIDHMHEAGIVHYVVLSKEEIGVAPAVDTSKFTVGELLRTLSSEGKADFIEDFQKQYAGVLEVSENILDKAYSTADSILVRDLPLEGVSINSRE